LAQNGLAIPVGYAIWGFSLIPSWAFMILVSFASRTMMSRRMNPTAPPRGTAPAGGQPAAGASEGAAPLTLSAPSLANASPEQRKEMIGERLFPLIESIEPQQVPKITGMLLESMEVPELLHLLQSPEALREKVDEALDVLKVHNQQAQGAPAVGLAEGNGVDQ